MSLERKLISTLTSPENIAQVWDLGLSKEAFEEPFCDHLYGFAVDYWHRSQNSAAPTLAMLREERPGVALYEEVEEESWWVAEELMKRQVANQVQEILIDHATEEAREDPVKALHSIREAAYRATEQITPRHSRSNMLDYQDRRLRYEKAEEGHEIGIPFGLSQLDYHTGGLRPGELCVTGAYSGVGKTMFLASVATYVRKIGYQPIFFTMEMGREEIEDRIDAFGSGVSYNQLDRKSLKPDEKALLYAWQEDLKRMGEGILVEYPPLGQRTVAHLVSRATQTNSDLILIDQLSHMEASQRFRSEKERKADIMKSLYSEINNGEKIPCILAAQLNRESLSADELELKHFADADEVGRYADYAFGLVRDKDLALNRMARLEVLKGRRRGPAAWMLKWDLLSQTLIQEHERIDR